MESHLLQMRGLKLGIATFTVFGRVASFTDAWIETFEVIGEATFTQVASFTDAWIETNERRNEILVIKVASFTDAWIETKSKKT